MKWLVLKQIALLCYGVKIFVVPLSLPSSCPVYGSATEYNS